NYEESVRVPIVLAAPGLLPAGAEVEARSRTIDLVPTLVELLGLEPHPKTRGKSLVALAKGESEPDERVVVSEGPASRAIMSGRHRLVVREGPAPAGDELFDLASDPGERRDLSKADPHLLAEMKARLEAALKNVPVVGTHAAAAPDTP